MGTDYWKNTKCRLCKSSHMEKVIDLVPTPVGDDFRTPTNAKHGYKSYPMDVYYCADCHFIQLADIVAPEKIYDDYLYETSISLGLAEHFQKYAKHFIEKNQLKPNSLILDIGSNDGTFLKAFKDLGMRVLGVEPAKNIAQKANRNGIETVCAYFNAGVAQEIKQKYGEVDAFTANNVMANIDDLDSLMEGVKVLLKPEGIFTYESGYLLNLIENDVLDNVYHEHISYFSVGPLVKFFAKHGLEYIDAEWVSTKGGSMRGTIQKKGAKRQVQASVEKQIQIEREAGLEKVQTFRAFDTKMKQNRDQFIATVKQLKKEGKKIAGYGASVGVTTLLYYYQMENDIDYLLDDNPIKHGLVAPGLPHIKIHPSDYIYEAKPDYIVLFPWRYVEPISKRHPKYVSSGGKYLVPLPSMTIIGK